MCKISVIVPALNEENNLLKAVENIIEAFNKLKVIGEIIIINDGSQDSTESIIKSLMNQYPFIKLISHKTSKGIGASFWVGVDESDGEFVTLLPGDAENDAFEIIRYLPLMDHVDVIIPFCYNKEARSPGRRMISKLYKGIINISFGMLLNYMNGTVMYRRSVLKSLTLRNGGFFYQTELLIKAIRKGYLYAEVDYAISQRSQGSSKALTLTSLKRVLIGYIATIFNIYLLDKINKNKKDLVIESVTALRLKQLD